MAYDLLLSSEIHSYGTESYVEPEDLEGIGTELASLITGNEVLRGVNFRVELFAKNIGSTDFPGGAFGQFRFETGGVGESSTKLPEIPKIRVEEKIPIASNEYLPYEEGVGWIKVKISSKDGEPVNLYQQKDGRAEEGKWAVPVSVVSREMIALVHFASRRG